MWLKRLTLVNWANLPRRTYEFEQITLVTGPTGSGKTTLLDAIQALMTATMKGLFSFNPGQDETSQYSRTKTPRTLASYALGCDDGQYARPDGSNTYVIGYFEPGDQEDGAPFSALLGVQATLAKEGSTRTPRENDTIMMIVHDLELGYSDVVRAGSQEHVVPLDTLLQHLRLQHTGHRFEPAVNKQEYVSQLYGAFSGHRGPLRFDQAKRAAKQFTQFMVYRKIDRLDSFVRNDILEAEDMREQVSQVSRLMRDVQRMRDDAVRIQEGVDRLKRAKNASDNIIDGLAAKVLWTFEEQARALRALIVECDQLKEQRAQLAAARVQSETEARDAKQRRDGLETRISGLKSQIAGSSSYQNREALLSQLESHLGDLALKAGELLTMNQTRHDNRECLEGLLQTLDRPAPWVPTGDVDWAKRFRDAVRGDGWRDLPVGDMIQREEFDALLNQEGAAKHIDRQYNIAVEALRAHRDEIGEAHYQAKEAAKASRREQEELDRDIARRESSGEVSYRPWTQAALELIRMQIPGASPRVICDHVEVTDERWQMAIEGMFGDQRFDIVVDEAYEADAIRLMNEVRRRTDRRVPAIVQGRQAREALRQTQRQLQDSVVEVMTFTDDTVAAFVQSAFARKLRVDSNEALTRERSGLTIDGNMSGGFRMRVVRIHESDLVFGRRARERALKSLKQKREGLDVRIEDLDRIARIRQRWYSAVNDGVKPLALGEAVEGLVYAEMGVTEARQQLTDLDISDIEAVTQEIDELKRQHDAADAAFEDARKALAKAEAQEDVLRVKIEDIDSEIVPAQSARDAAREVVDRYRTIAPTLGWDEALRRIEQQLDSPNMAMPEESQPRQANYYGKLAEALSEFNASAYQGMQVRNEGAWDHTRSPEEQFRTMVLLAQGISLKLNKLEDNILVRNREELERANERFQQTFITDVCLKMNSLINDGRRMLQQLNERLRHHYFGNEYYEFDWKWRSDMKPYADFFARLSAVRPESQHGDLFERPDLSDQDREIFETLQHLLLQQDARQAERDLERLTDYREYRSYDILKRFTDPDREPISLKSYGTGSGGQTENPSYVIRSAALSSALRWSEGNTHLRFVIIDESFSKLDEQRSKECLQFLADVLGLQVIFVITDKSSGPMHDAVDLKFDVSKLPSREMNGELKTRVLVQPAKMKRQAVRELFEREKIMVRSRASQRLAFLENDDERPET